MTLALLTESSAVAGPCWDCVCAQDILKVKELPEPSFGEPAADDLAAAGEMFFTKPQQLLQVYSDLEESNLFLIQVTAHNCLAASRGGCAMPCALFLGQHTVCCQAPPRCTAYYRCTWHGALRLHAHCAVQHVAF